MPGVVLVCRVCQAVVLWCCCVQVASRRQVMLICSFFRASGWIVSGCRCQHSCMQQLTRRAPASASACSAADHIRRGDADLMLAGGSEASIIPSAIGGFIACKALSKRNDDPEAASRPWDQGRDGFVMGEGAGAWGQAVRNGWWGLLGAVVVDSCMVLGVADS